MLVFVQSKERARELFHELVYEGINVDVIHAERTQQQVQSQTIHQGTGLKCSLALLSFYLLFLPPERQRREQFSFRKDLGFDLHSSACQRNRLQGS